MKKLTSHKVYQALKEHILAGTFVAGEKLSTERIAKIINVSHTPVREALRMVAREGLVELKANRGAYVRALNHDEAIEIYKIRRVLDGLAAFEMAQNASASEAVKHLFDCCRQYKEAQTEAENEKVDYEFHTTIFNSSGMRFLSGLATDYLVLSKTFGPSRMLLVDIRGDDWRERAYQEHIQIALAIEHGLADVARELAMRHTDFVLNLLCNKNNAGKSASAV